jgi:hypothetical protein
VPAASRFVIVTGLPASGKSVIGRSIAAGLALPLLDKDDFLEALFQEAGPPDIRARQALSRLADESFRTRATSERRAVLISWWRHPRSPSESGTPSDWLPRLPGTLVEVHCVCSPTVAAQRFLARKRHPGHLDSERSYPRLLEQFNQQATLGPLGVGVLVKVNTDEVVDAAAVLQKVKKAFQVSPEGWNAI